ncbi:hypothetical protein HPP92_018020 [Vanilla planifolia]|uniref:Uncharacterized protein n=1 Tax=Vanilla planifolia TaxID=51239 RepID=A0A835Q8Z8_VANPL|nr:hypothetical protein HPP92_018020 [Vanilla planifolia]
MERAADGGEDILLAVLVLTEINRLKLCAICPSTAVWEVIKSTQMVGGPRV